MNATGEEGGSGNLSCEMSEEEARAAQIINAVVPLFLVFAGNVFNILAILVMRTKHFRFLSTSVYMVAGAINDAISLVVALIPHWLNANFPLSIVRTPTSYVMCGFFNFYGWSNCDFGIIVTAAMTADRAYAIFDPLKSTSRDLTKRARRTLVGLTAVVVAKNFHFWFVSDIVPFGQPERLCIVDSPSQNYMFFYQNVWPFLHLTFLTVCFLVIIVSNSIIIHHVRRSAKGKFSMSPKKLRRDGPLVVSNASRLHGEINEGFSSSTVAGEHEQCNEPNNQQIVDKIFEESKTHSPKGILSKMKEKPSKIFRTKLSFLGQNTPQNSTAPTEEQCSNEHKSNCVGGRETTPQTLSPKPASPSQRLRQRAQQRTGQSGAEAQGTTQKKKKEEEKTRRRRRRTTRGTPRSVKQSRRGSRSSEKWRQITVMLLADSFTLVLLTYPFSSFLAVSLATAPPASCAQQAVAALWFSATFYLLYSNKCVNFCLYCITGSRFRQALREVICGRCCRCCCCCCCCCGAGSPSGHKSRLPWLSSRLQWDRNSPTSGGENSSEDPHCASISAAVEASQAQVEAGAKVPAPVAKKTPDVRRSGPSLLPQVWVTSPESAASPVWETCFGSGAPRTPPRLQLPEEGGKSSPDKSRLFYRYPVVDSMENIDLNDSGFDGDSFPAARQTCDLDRKRPEGDSGVQLACNDQEEEEEDLGSTTNTKSVVQHARDNREMFSQDSHRTEQADVFCVYPAPLSVAEQRRSGHSFSVALSGDAVEIFV